MDVSNYSRRENDQIKIDIKEWQKLAEVLDVPLEQIYETDDHSFLIAQGLGNNLFSNNTTNQILHYLQKYIEKLEIEIKDLKEELTHLKTSKQKNHPESGWFFYLYLNEYYSPAFSSVESAASAVGASAFSSATGASATTASTFLAGVALLLLLVTFFSSALGL